MLWVAAFGGLGFRAPFMVLKGIDFLPLSSGAIASSWAGARQCSACM